MSGLRSELEALADEWTNLRPDLSPSACAASMLALLDRFPMEAEDGSGGCDCTELCSMGPTCPGGMLANLPGSGCWRTTPAPVSRLARIALTAAEVAALGPWSDNGSYTCARRRGECNDRCSNTHRTLVDQVEVILTARLAAAFGRGAHQ